MLAGYDTGFLPPMHCSFPFGYYFNCSKGNTSTEPCMAAHNILLAHASAARPYKKNYQVRRSPGIWGLFDVMKKNAGSRLPSFLASESERIKGPTDFFGINFYNVLHVKDNPEILKMEPRDYSADTAVELKFVQDNKLLPLVEFPVTPWGLQGVLDYFKQTYGNPPIFIHENGQWIQRNATLEDWPRVKSLHRYIGALLDSVRNGLNARGYFTWSLLDVLELLDGYEAGFSLYYMDLDVPELRRYPKLSARWYLHFLKEGSVGSDGFVELERNISSTFSSVEVFK